MAMRAGAHGVAGATAGLEAGKLGIWWFLASEIMLFGGLIASYVVFRLGGEGWAAEAAHLNTTIGIVNTLILLSSSLTVVQAFAAAERGETRATTVFLGLTVLGGLLFLGLKAVEYAGELGHGFTPASGLFWSFYYLMTGLHALHVLTGVVINLILLAGRRWRTPHRVELGGLYWHFVDVVWVFLFPLLYLA